MERNYYRVGFLVNLVAVALMVASCSEDDPVVDSTPPEVTSLTITSDNANPMMAVPGDTLTIELLANESILLPPIRLNGQSRTPEISAQGGGGSRWVYTFLISENFNLTVPAELSLVPFRIRDIQGNLSEEPATTFNEGSVLFTPDLVGPELINDQVALFRLPTPDFGLEGDLFYFAILVGNERLQEPNLSIVEGSRTSSFDFTPSIDGLTWFGTALRSPRDTSAGVEINLNIQDLGGNPILFSLELTAEELAALPAVDIPPDPSQTPVEASLLTLSSGLPDWEVLNADGFVDENVPLIITTPDTSFSPQSESIRQMDSSRMHWSLDDNNVITLDFLATEPDGAAPRGLALFTTQFFPAPDAINTQPDDISGLTKNKIVDLTAYADGAIVFEIMVPDYTGFENLLVKVDHSSGPDFCACEQSIGKPGEGEWETVVFPLSRLTGASTSLDLENVRTGIVLFPDFTSQVAESAPALRVMLRNIRWEATIPQMTDMPTATATESPNLENLTDTVAATMGVALSATTFTNSATDGGAISECAPMPALPAGIQVSPTTDGSTCEISGTPGAITESTEYMVTATNAIGTSTATVTIVVGDVAPHGSISVVPATSDAPTGVGTELTLFDDSLQNGFDELFTFANSGAGVEASLVDSGDTARGMVAQYSTTAESMAVLGIGSTTSTDLSTYAGGVLQFDMRVTDLPDGTGSAYRFKVGTGNNRTVDPDTVRDPEVSLGGLSLFPLNEWRTVRIDLSMEPWVVPDDPPEVTIEWNMTDIIQAFPAWGTANGTVLQLDRIIIYPPSP